LKGVSGGEADSIIEVIEDGLSFGLIVLCFSRHKAVDAIPLEFVGLDEKVIGLGCDCEIVIDVGESVFLQEGVAVVVCFDNYRVVFFVELSDEVIGAISGNED